MPDDVGGQPFPNGEGPDSQDLGSAEEAFASVVLDEDFVEAARIHEPTAAERILYAAMERAESEAAGELGFYRDPDLDPGSSDGLVGFDADDEADEEGRFDRSDYTRYLPDEDGDGPAYGSYTAYGDGGYGSAGTLRGPGSRGAQPPAWRPTRWQRPVACVLAMVMGISVIAFALIAIQRAGSAPSRVPGPTPPVSEPDRGGAGQTITDPELREGDR